MAEKISDVQPDTPVCGKDRPASREAFGLPREWLLFRLSSLGDAALCTGLIRYLHSRLGWTFAVLTRPELAPLFENNPLIRELVLPDARQLKFPGSVGFFRQVAESHQNWGLLDLHHSLRSRLLGFFWNGPVRRYPKFTAVRRKFLLTKDPEASSFLRSASVTQRYAMAVLNTPPPRAELLPEVHLRESEKTAARELICGLAGRRRGPLAALHPFATHARKAWPREYWLELLNLLEAEGINWVIVGQGEALRPNDGRDLTGRTSLRELTAVLGEADFLITGDSGPMHLAAAVGTPVVAMFGPTTAEWGFFPAGAGDVALELPLDCRPCSLHGAGAFGAGGHCGGRCLRDLAPTAVLGAVLQSMGRRAG